MTKWCYCGNSGQVGWHTESECGPLGTEPALNRDVVEDITIPADDAKRLAAALRHQIIDPGREERLRWADLLDPPAPSLRDEVHAAIIHDFDHWTSRDTADAVLAVVRRHIAPLTFNASPPYEQAIRDVLRLLAGGDG